MGILERVFVPLSSMYSRLRCRFRCGGSVGEEFVATNGILQRYPLSVVLLNALMAVWSRAVEAEVRSASAISYADDTEALVSSRANVTGVARITGEFARLSGQEVNVKKSFAFTTVPGRRIGVTMGSSRIGWMLSAKLVGAPLTFQGTPESNRLQGLVDECRVIAKLSSKSHF